VLAAFLARPAFGPYMVLLGQNKAYEPAALAIISFALTWAAISLMYWLNKPLLR
jgi:putative spermidine/putrescine transport system permease protein